MVARHLRELWARASRRIRHGSRAFVVGSALSLLTLPVVVDPLSSPLLPGSRQAATHPETGSPAISLAYTYPGDDGRDPARFGFSLAAVGDNEVLLGAPSSGIGGAAYLLGTRGNVIRVLEACTGCDPG